MFGSPGGRPTTRQVRAALDELGVGAKDVMLAPDQPGGATRMVASDDRGAIEVRVLGRDEAEAYAMLLAERAGCPFATSSWRKGRARRGVARHPPSGCARTTGRGRPGDRHRRLESSGSGVPFAGLHAAHVVHGRLNAHHVAVGSTGVALVDFDRASGATTTAPRTCGRRRRAPRQHLADRAALERSWWPSFLFCSRPA
jgi:hypothetical protein